MAMSLRAARVNRELSQKQVGDIIGVSPATICRWEKGTSKMTRNQFLELVKIYNKSETDINPPPNITSPKETEIQ